MFTGTNDNIFACKSKGLSKENIKTSYFNPKLTFIHNAKIRVNLNEIVYNKTKSFNHSNIGSFFIPFEFDTFSPILNANFTLKDCLFGEYGIAMVYWYYICMISICIGFDWHSSFSLSNGEFGKNVIIFIVDKNSSRYLNSWKIFDRLVIW